jgi:hypothetical protein
MAASWTSGPKHARFRPRYGERCSSATAPAASRVARADSARGITSGTGPREAPPRSQTSSCSVAATIARFTKRVIRSIEDPTANFGFGALIPDVPPPSAVPADPVEATRARNAAEGVRVGARRSTPGWFGERLDLGWAIDVLQPLAR